MTEVGVADAGEDLVALAHAALQRGAFAEAIELLEQAIAEHDSAEACVELGGIRYYIDDFQGTRELWERAFRRFRETGSHARAVRIAGHLGELHMSILGNESAGRGWISRGRRLLDGLGRCVEVGYFELALLACDRLDPDAVERSAEVALELAIEFGDTDLEVRALSDGGLAMVAQGRLTEGFARLDEAMTVISAGELTHPHAVGRSFCAMVSACDRAGDLRRAEEWTRLINELMQRQFGGSPLVLVTHCRAAYGAVLSSAGRWDDAEAAMLEALGPNGSSSEWHRAETTARLAELRLMQGRIEEAAVLLQPYEDRVSSCVALAGLYSARGESDLAAAVIKRGLAAMASDRLRVASLLGLLVDIELGRGDLTSARQATDRLGAVAAAGDAPLIAIEAAMAEGRLALAIGEPQAAVDHFERALGLAGDDEQPMLCATIRTELAGALAATGATAEGTDQARAALATFERLGAQRHADRAAAVLRRLGSGAGSRSRPRVGAGAVEALSQRERDVLELLQAGLTNAEIGERLFISPKTAEHHVGRILTKLGVRSRAEAAAIAATALTP